MSHWPPPSIPRAWLVGIVLLYGLLAGYAFLVAQQVLPALLVAVLLGVLYLLWRFLAALEAIADAQQRLADQREHD